MASSRVGFFGIVLLALAGACATTTPPAPPAPPPAVAPPAGGAAAALDCKRGDAFGPIAVDPAQYLARTGAGATTFAALSTTPQLPLEECGIRGVLKRLVSLRCNDGKNPFDGDMRAAHHSRAGSLGPGGRCGSIIDRYEVSCPETTYPIFADSYICPEGVVGGP